MPNKKIMMLTVLLACLLAISAVSAQNPAAGTENTTNLVGSTDEAVLGSSTTEELQKDTEINEHLSVDTDCGKLEMSEGELLGDEIYVTGDNFTDISKATDDAKDGDIIYLQGGHIIPSISSGSEEEPPEIPKWDAIIDFYVPDNAGVGQDAFITVIIHPRWSATGTVNLIIGDKNIAESIVDGQVSFNVNGLSAGNHTFTIVYSGDEIYYGQTVSGLLTVYNNVVVDCDDITITVLDNSTVIVIVDGEPIYNENGLNGTVDIPLGNLTPGNHDITVIVTDGNGNSYEINESIDVPKWDVELTVDVPANVFVGQDAFITVIIDPSVASGSVTLIIGDKNITELIVDGQVSFNVNGLSSGNHAFTIVYSGDEYYNNETVAGLLTVYNINVVVDGGDITITVPENTANVIVIFDGGNPIVVNPSDIDSGTVIIPNGLSAGEHNITVIAIDEKGNVISETQSIDVVLREPKIVIDIPNVIPVNGGDDIVVDLPSDATGDVDVFVDGEFVVTVPVENGAAVIPIDELGLTPSNHTIGIVYSGDDKYDSTNASTEITVAPMEFEVVDDEIILNLPDNSVVIVKVGDDVIYNGPGSGAGVVSLESITPGNHDVTIIVADIDGNSYMIKDNIDVPLHNLEIVIDIPSVVPVIGADDFVIDLPSDSIDEVIVFIDGKEALMVPVIDGKAVIPFDELELTPGNHSIGVAYSGDDNYNPVRTEDCIFTVAKLPSTVSVEVTGIKWGDVATITVAVPEDAIGKVFVDLGIVKSYGEIKDGEAVITIPGLPKGSYTVNAMFEGDSKYGASNGTGSFDVVKDPEYFIKVTMVNGLQLTCVLTDDDGKAVVNAPVSYTLGDGKTVNVTTNDKGEFVCDVKSNSILTMSYTDGNVSCSESIVIKNMALSQKATQIVVPSNMQRTAVDYNAGEKGFDFTFKLLDSDGNPLANKAVKIGIFNKTYAVKTNNDGEGALPINIANANYYTYAVVFLGDDDYKASMDVCSLQIVKKSVTIAPAKTSYSFASSAKTKTVSATLKSTNSYIPKGKQVTLTIAGKTFKATIGDKGQINFNIGSITKKGTYKVDIKFAGTNTYAAANSKTITIKIA